MHLSAVPSPIHVTEMFTGVRGSLLRRQRHRLSLFSCLTLVFSRLTQVFSICRMPCSAVVCKMLGHFSVCRVGTASRSARPHPSWYVLPFLVLPPQERERHSYMGPAQRAAFLRTRHRGHYIFEKDGARASAAVSPDISNSSVPQANMFEIA